MLEVGMKAPKFSLKDENGDFRSLDEFKGKKVILYFYPKDNTPGCTKQACGFRDLYPQIEEKDAVVIGVNKYSVESHKKFKEKNGLPFILLSDKDLEVTKAYDVWKEKKIFGNTGFGIERSTYLIDENGIIQKAFNKVKASKNPDDMLNEL